MNTAMWFKALRVIPQIDQEEWKSLDIISKWMIASRSAVLVITFISAAIAGILAIRQEKFDIVLWLIVTFGLLMAHATNNLVNDITDSWKGVDKGDDAFRSQYGPQPIEHGLLTTRQMLVYAAITGLIALAAGIYLVYARGGYTLLLLGLGVFFALLYTWPLKHIGLGEVAVLLVWGPLMIGGGYYVITGEWSWEVTLAGLPYALGATTVIFGKHIDKLKMDKKRGLHTLPVILGDRNSRYVAIAMMVLQYVMVVTLVIAGFFTLVMLLVVAAIGKFRIALKVFREPKPEKPPEEYPEEGWPLWYVAFAFLHNRTYGFYFLVALLIDTLLVRFNIVAG
ncbi:MAG TPA: prenyltransferase [candidate division Zixibacteria bacterium]|nr:prenyltransferase [candidate division Zixibacteria bacterium]